MKKHLIMGLALTVVASASFALSGCGPANNSESNLPTISENEQTSIKKLKIEALPTKTKFAVGDKFTSEGLTVALIETDASGAVFKTITTDYKLSIKEGTILEEGEFEVMVISNEKGVRSTSFNIVVELDVKLSPLIDIVNTLVKDNNFTVKNTLGGTNEITGLITKDALIWNSNEEAYFMDEGAGYGTYNGNTYRFNVIDGQIKNAIYLKDTGSKAEDKGLFSPDTLDEMAERRISNYNIQNITDEELNYLKNDCKPVANNPNRYQIDIHYCKWLFNAIAHTQLTINPTYFLSQGTNPGKVYVEVKEYGLDIDLITADTFDGVRGCVATITNIGDTKIPGMAEFIKNPTFGEKKTTLDVLQENLNNDNYNLITVNKDTSATFTKDYVYSKTLEKGATNKTGINIKENNKLSLKPGYYNLTTDEEGKFSISNKTIEKTSLGYLTNFDLFASLDQYFVQDATMINKYVYTLTDELEKTSQLKEFIALFSDITAETKINQVGLEIIMAGKNIFQVNIEFINDDNSLDPISLMNFGKSKLGAIDALIETLY